MLQKRLKELEFTKIMAKVQELMEWVSYTVVGNRKQVTSEFVLTYKKLNKALKWEMHPLSKITIFYWSCQKQDIFKICVPDFKSVILQEFQHTDETGC